MKRFRCRLGCGVGWAEGTRIPRVVSLWNALECKQQTLQQRRTADLSAGDNALRQKCGFRRDSSATGMKSAGAMRPFVKILWPLIHLVRCSLLVACAHKCHKWASLAYNVSDFEVISPAPAAGYEAVTPHVTYCFALVSVKQILLVGELSAVVTSVTVTVRLTGVHLNKYFKTTVYPYC